MDPLESIVDFLKQTDELDTAEVLLNTFAKYSNSLPQFDKLGKLYCDIKNYRAAVKYTEKALSIAPTNESMFSCRSNLAKLYNHLNDPEKSLFYLNINHNLEPNNYDIQLEKVFSLFLLNRKEESEKILRDLLDYHENVEALPDNVINRVKFNLGTYDLYKGKFQQGLKGFILVGKHIGIWKDIKLPFKFWDGGIIPDQEIIICAEGGIGDEIINIRFMKHITDLGMNPIWYTTRKDLVKLFNRHGFRATSDLSEYKSKAGEVMWTYSMALPIYLDITEHQLWREPYLKALGTVPLTSSKIKVGLKWSGNPKYEQDLHRSVPLTSFVEILSKFDNIELFSLQRDEGKEEADKYIQINQYPEYLDTWDDTLNYINSLDLVVTSCTSIAHAAAALGKHVCIFAPITAYYTWASTTDETSIWYGENTKIFRQVKHKCWKQPLQQLSGYLTNFKKDQ